MTTDTGSLGEAWRMHLAAATTLALSEKQMQRVIREASVEQLAALIETYSPARSLGPEWTRTFEPLVERLWAWRDEATMAALAETFGKRGPAWAAVANALAAENGARVRASLRQPAWARLPAFALM